MLSVKNVTKIYQTEKSKNEVVALDNVSIDFPEKGFVFLLGKSGSGKSTLLNVIGGLDVFNSGEIVIKGKSSKNFTQSDFDSYRNTFIGFIFQEYNILENFTVAKNLALALELQGKKATKEHVNELLAQVEMLDYANRKPNQLSGGQKQRVAIARALIKNPEIIMADEPTGALDSNTGKQVMDTLKELSKTKLVIVVSHDRDFAEIYGDRIIELKDGKIISDVIKKEIPSVEVESSMKIIDENILYIKKGEKISKAQLKQITDFVVEKSKNSDTFISFDTDTNKKLKESAKITDEGNREKFVDTKPEDLDVKVYNPNSLNLIKSRLKFADSFKIGVSSLKHKVGRLIFTILLSFFAFTVFGIVNTLSCWNRPNSVYEAITLTDSKFVSLQKRVKDGNDYYSDSIITNDINKLNNLFPKYKIKSIVRGSYISNLNYDGEYVNIERNYDNPYYYLSLSGFTTITQSELDSFDFTLTGRLPVNDNEIAIPKHILDILCDLTTDNSNPIVPEKYTEISFYKTNSSENYKVVGIIDDKTDLSKLKNLDEEKDAIMMMMLSNMINFGFTNMGYVCDSEYERLSSLGTNTLYISNDNHTYYTNRDDFSSLSEAFENYKLENGVKEFISPKNPDVKLIYTKRNWAHKWEIMDLSGNTLFWYEYSVDFLYDNNGAYVFDKDYEDFCAIYGEDADGDKIPDNFTTDVTDYTGGFVESRINYYKDGSIFSNGEFVKLAKNEVLLPYTYLQTFFGYDWKDKLDDGLEVTVRKNYRKTDIKLKIVGATNAGIYMSDETYNDTIKPLYEGASYIITALTGDDESFIKYCETYDKDGIKFVVQNSATEILDTLEDAMLYTAKIFLYVAIGFAVFAAILLMNFISISIIYKKREIGVLRALGARGGDIFGIFLNESTVISLINFALSSIATFVICYIINSTLLAKLGIDIVLLTPGFRQVLLILAVSWGSAFISSLIPTMKISKKKPIDAINNR